MQQPSDSIVADLLPVVGLFSCGFAGWAGALILKRRLRHRLQPSRPGHKKVDDEPEPLSGVAAESPEPGRRPVAPRRQARRRQHASAGQEPQSPAVAAAGAPGGPECPAAPAEQDRPAAALPPEQAEAVPPVPQQAGEVPQSARVTRLLAKKAARKARKAAEAETEKEQQQLSAVAPTAEVEEQQPLAAAASMTEADEEQPLAAAAPVAEAQDEQPPLATAATPMAKPEEEQPLSAAAVADAAEEIAGQDGGDGPDRVPWAAQEEEEGEWTGAGARRPRLSLPLPQPEGARGAQCAYYGDHGSQQWDYWADEHSGGGAWKRGPGRWRGGGWRGEAKAPPNPYAGPNSEELDSWMAPFDTLSRRPAPQVALQQQQLIQPAQAPVVSPVVCPDGQTAYCDGSRMYTPVGGSGSVFTDGEQTYEMACFQVTLPLQDPGSPPGMEGLGHGFKLAGDAVEEEFDPYDPAGLAPRGHQERRWNGDDAGWSRSWGRPDRGDSWSRGWDPSW